MASQEKTLKLIGKLLRLAAPDSGTNENERSVAALELARLISENNLSIGDSVPTAQQSHQPQQQKQKVAHGIWLLSVALQHTSCEQCGRMISRADVIWLRVVEGRGIQYRHNTDSCKPRS